MSVFFLHDLERYLETSLKDKRVNQTQTTFEWIWTRVADSIFPSFKPLDKILPQTQPFKKIFF